jgi:membrane protein implicated in regulation of membrane protease activity
VVLRYLAFQVPGWMVLALVLAGAMAWWELSATLAGAVFALFVLKDAVLFPFVRAAYEPRSGGGAEALVGERARAEEALAPEGYVRIGAELWRAELARGRAERGAVLRVVAVRGLTLVVEPEEGGGEA